MGKLAIRELSRDQTCDIDPPTGYHLQIRTGTTQDCQHHSRCSGGVEVFYEPDCIHDHHCILKYLLKGYVNFTCEQFDSLGECIDKDAIPKMCFTPAIVFPDYHCSESTAPAFTTIRLCNTDTITINDNSPATPYPATLTYSVLGTQINKVTVELVGLTHTWPADLRIFIQAPSGGAVMLMGWAGGSSDVNTINLLFDDAASSVIPVGSILPGSYRPADYSVGFVSPPAAPAPQPPFIANLSGLAGTNPNGVWKLWVLDDFGADVGRIQNGFCVSTTYVGFSPSSTISSTNSISATASITPSMYSGSRTPSISTSQTATISRTPSASGSQSGTRSATRSSSFSKSNSPTNSKSRSTTPSITPSTTPVPLVGSSTFCKNDQITINDNVRGIPYPSILTISGTGIVIEVQVKILGFSHTFPGDLNVVIESPSGLSVALMSSSAGGQDLINLDMTFDDSGVNVTSQNILNNVMIYRPTDSGGFLNSYTPGPQRPYILDLAGLVGTSADGNWKLWVSDHVGGDVGAISNGFCVILTYGFPSNTPNPSESKSISTTRSITRSITPSNSFSKSNSPPTSVSRSTSLTPSLSKSSSISDSPSSSISASSTPLFFVQPAATACSFASINIPDSGPASLYPSTVMFSGLGTEIQTVSVDILGLSHTFPGDIIILLESPSGATVLLMGWAGGGTDITSLDLTFVDTAPGPLPGSALTSGSYRPTDYLDGSEVIAPPAPQPQYYATLSGLETLNPNGEWRLWVLDSFAADEGSISGFCVHVASRIFYQ